MQMWDFLKLRRPRKSKGNNEPVSSGFTLLEMLMVMFIVGLSASLVMPNLPALYDRLSFALERDTFIRKLNDLPHAAMDANQDIVLVGEFSASKSNNKVGAASEYVSIEDLGVRVPYRNPNIRQAMLEVPENWIVNVPEPIFYRLSGFCSGGEIVIETKYLRYVMSAEAPYCDFTEEPG